MAPRAEHPSPDIAAVGEPGSRDRKREEVGAPSSEEAGHAQDESREGSWLGRHRCHPDETWARHGQATKLRGAGEGAVRKVQAARSRVPGSYTLKDTREGMTPLHPGPSGPTEGAVVNEDEARGAGQLVRATDVALRSSNHSLDRLSPKGHETVPRGGSPASPPTRLPVPGWAPPPSGSSREAPLAGCSWFAPSPLGHYTRSVRVPLSQPPNSSSLCSLLPSRHLPRAERTLYRLSPCSLASCLARYLARGRPSVESAEM